MNKAEYQTRSKKMNDAIVQWMLDKCPTSAQIDYALNKAQAVQYHWYYQVTDWDNIDLLAFYLIKKS